MYVCLCKALTEADVSIAARECLDRGVCDLDDVLETLNLRCEDACGYCVENPEIIEAIVADEAEATSPRPAARSRA
jgi:bacterioferritin-associated ferredoxin